MFISRRLLNRILVTACSLILLVRAVRALSLREIDQLPAPTNATIMVYSPVAGALVLKNSASAVAVIEIASRGSIIRLANSWFTDIGLSPSGRYAFACDLGGETNYVHRIDLFNMTWDVRTAYIVGNVQALADTQIVLKSLSQWVLFTNNDWGSGPDLIPLNTSSGYPWGPGYYAVVYAGNFRFDIRTGRLIHGNSDLSSQEIQAFKIVNNDFIRQEGSGVYGSAQGYGGTVVLATDSSAFYYGRLQVDPLDVTHNLRVFPELIYAANGRIALGNGNYYDPCTGGLLGALPFKTTVYALNPQGDDFWAYDPATTTVHHFTPVTDFYTVAPCRLVDTRQPVGPYGAPALAAGADRTFVIGGQCGVPADAQAVSVNLTVTQPTDSGSLRALPAGGSLSLVSNMNWRGGRTIANNAVVQLGPAGEITVHVDQPTGSVQLIIDINGYFR